MSADPNAIATDAGAVINAVAPFSTLAGPYGAAAILAAQGALAIYKGLIPVIQDMINKGVITVDQQAAVAAQWNDLAVTHKTAFTGPEWQQD
jgi:hypothetical protein